LLQSVRDSTANQAQKSYLFLGINQTINYAGPFLGPEKGIYNILKAMRMDGRGQSQVILHKFYLDVIDKLLCNSDMDEWINSTECGCEGESKQAKYAKWFQIYS
jgi:hypothetical protein